MEVIFDPKAAKNTGSYSPALKFDKFIVVSGQGPISPDGMIVSGSIEEETRL